MIIFLRIETIKGKGEKKAGRYSLRSELKPESSAALESEIKVKQGTVEIHVHESLTRKLQDFAEFHKHPASIKNIRIGETLTQQLEWEEVLGIEIYQTFFPGFIGKTFEGCLNLLHQEKIENLTLIIGSSVPWILDIPFEMMRKERGSQPLSVCHENFHLVHSIETSLHGFQEAAPEASAPPLKILFVSALPVDLPDEDRLIELEKEQELLIGAVGDLISEQKVVVEFLDIATLEEIEKSLREGQHQVVHFSGHGAHKAESSQESGVLYLEDEWGRVKAVTGQELAQSLKKFSTIRLVVLSACETARADESGVAGALLKAGIPALLGMRYPAGDDAARLFTTCLYQDICAGKSLEYAIYFARKAVYDADKRRIKKRKKEKEESLIVTEWMTPFLFQVRNIRQLLDHTKKPSPTHHFFHKPQNLLVEGAKYIGRGFIGRHKEILNLHRLFREGHRGVCIYGQGGTGKTTLAVRFAHHFEKGAFRIIRFDNAVSEESILSRLAEAASPSLGEGIKNFVQSPDYDPVTKLNLLIEDFLSKEKIILLLDNFEENQIATTMSDGSKIYQREIYSESLKAFLVHLCKNLKNSSFILFTTRYRFTEPEVVYLNLGEMRFSDTFKLINRFQKLVKLSPQEKLLIHQKLGGHPRALELLESCISHDNIGWNTVNQKFQQVEDQEIKQDLLLDMLWNQLNDDEKMAIMGASIFRGLTTTESLMAITIQNEETIEQSLKSLNARSLLYLEHNQFYTHRLTATYVLTTKMNKNQIKDFHAKAAEYFKTIFNKDERTFIYEGLEARWHLLEAEKWNFAALITLSLGENLRVFGYPQHSLEIIDESLEQKINEPSRASLYHLKGMLSQNFGDYQNAVKQYQSAMAIFKKFDFKEGVSLSLHHIGWIYHDKGYYNKALKFYQKSLEISKECKNIRGIGFSLHHIGWIYQDKGDSDRALKNYQESMEIFESLGDLKNLSSVINNIANIYKEKGDHEEAITRHQKAIRMRRKVGDIKGVSDNLYNIGTIYISKGDYEKALRSLQESLEISERIGDIKGISDCLYSIGLLHSEKEDYNEALKLYEKALELKEEIEDIKGISDILHNIGMISKEKGDYDEAMKHYKKSTELKKKIGDEKGILLTYHEIQSIHVLKKDYKKATKYSRKSMEFDKKIGDPKIIANNYLQNAAIYQAKGDNEAALDQYHKAMGILEEIQDKEKLSYCLPLVGMIYQSKGDYDKALVHYQKSLEIIDELNDKDNLPSTLHQIGMLYQDKGDYDRALKHYKRALNIFKEMDNEKGIGDSLHQIGMIYQYKGNYEGAIEHYKRSMEIDEKVGDQQGVGNSLHQIGMLYQDIGDYDSALENYQKAMKIRKKIDDIKGVSYSLNQIGLILQKKGEYKKALKHYEASIKIKERFFDVRGISSSLLNIGNVYYFKGNYEEALKNYEKSMKISEMIGDMVGAARNYAQVGKLHFDKQEYTTALKYFVRSFLIFSNNEMPLAQMAKDFIQRIRQKIPEAQFKEILNDFKIDSDTFDHENRYKDETLKLLINLTIDAISITEKSLKEKEQSIDRLNKMIKILPNDNIGKRIKAYFSMLLAFAKGRDYKKYQSKIPRPLIEIFEKALEKKDIK